MKSFLIRLFYLLAILDRPIIGADASAWTTDPDASVVEVRVHFLERLEQLSQAATIEAIYALDRRIEGTPEANRTSPRWKALRNVKAEFWLRGIAALDKIVDPHFDPNDRPLLTVRLPLDPNSAILIGPDGAFKDPQEQAKYEKAVRKNQEKGRYYEVQAGLRQMRESWTQKIGSYVKKEFDGENRDDIVTMVTLVNTHIKDESTKSRIAQVLPPAINSAITAKTGKQQ